MEDDPLVAVVPGTSVGIASTAVVRAVAAQVEVVDALRDVVAVEGVEDDERDHLPPSSAFAAVRQPHLLSRVRATTLLHPLPQVHWLGEIVVPVRGADGHSGLAKQHIALHDVGAAVAAAYDRSIVDDSSEHFDAAEQRHNPLRDGSNALVDSAPLVGPGVP